MKNLMLTLLIIGVLSALFTVVMQSFDNHQIADIAHFISYLLMLFVVLRTFTRLRMIAGFCWRGITVLSDCLSPPLCWR